MDISEASRQELTGDPLIVKADEVDHTGTAISTLGTADQSARENLRGTTEGPLPATFGQGNLRQPFENPGLPIRPGLRRDGSAPAPPSQPPPPAPPLQDPAENPTDSLSLAQLKRLVNEMPKVEQPAYAFEYADAQDFTAEVDEWFEYGEQESNMLLNTRESFEQKWRLFCELSERQSGEEPSWLDVSDDQRKNFLKDLIKGLRSHESFESHDAQARLEYLEAIAYILCGAWGLTAGLTSSDDHTEHNTPESPSEPDYKLVQLRWIRRGVQLWQECQGIQTLFEHFRRLMGKESDQMTSAEGEQNEDPNFRHYHKREITMLLTCCYLVVESARDELAHGTGESLRNELVSLQPNTLVFFVEVISRLRWDESPNIPLNRLLLLFWKLLLVLFGGTADLDRVKAALQTDPERPSTDSGHPFLTASPLDYHLFRQEITSKYPAYNPPPPLVPLELENNSILPPLPNHSSRQSSIGGLFSAMGPSSANSNVSILNQPVHIATPAPSPPPSPAGPGGKAGKKQNYQTNQNFPFLYPPLDDTSNKMGGRGTSELQDALVSKKWEGSDVPASIIEAGKLFASRMRMSRATWQLWEERELFMKYDRGWDGKELGLEEPSTEERREGSSTEHKKKETDDVDAQRRLDSVETFYGEAMPHLQSIVIVLLKVILTNVTAIVTQANGSNGLGPGFQAPENGAANAIPRNKSNVNVTQPGANGTNKSGQAAEADTSIIEDLEATRSREISGKAVSGTLLLLLKWFKLSHVLKFEYLTQLLLDSNYLPLILKLFAHQNVEEIIAQQNDKDELGFFHFCHLNSDHPPLSPTSLRPDTPVSDASSSDDAAPPPILRHRRSPTSTTDPSSQTNPNTTTTTTSSSSDQPVPPPLRPEVDELGYPTAPLPQSPIETYSWRNFFSSITLLRIMQKITSRKAHRCLLLVQYKSSTILRKALKVPDPLLRLYTLKLFKSQVPYCGRKWRQSNMRVITAIYLYCRPELRDVWLANSDVDAEVDEALPLEQALRGLTHWWHLRCYKDVMMGKAGGGKDGEKSLADEALEEDRDFFTRELDSMGWGMGGEEVGFGEEAPGQMMNGNGGGAGTTEWEGGPLQMEGW